MPLRDFVVEEQLSVRGGAGRFTDRKQKTKKKKGADADDAIPINEREWYFRVVRICKP